MDLSKKDLVLLHDFIDSKNIKYELNFALLGRGGLYATDTRKLIKIHYPQIDDNVVLCSKKLLKGFISTLTKDSVAILHSDGRIHHGNIVFDMNTCNEFGYKYPESIESTIDTVYEKHFSLDSLDDIGFELTERFCFIEDVHLLPLIKHGTADNYDVFFKPMGEKEEVSRVKIVATVVRDEEDVVLYTAVIMGRQFHTAAK